MLDHIPLRENYSSTVELTLIVNGQTISLCGVGPWSVSPREQVDLPEKTTGQVRMSIDGRVHSWDVVMPHGAVPFEDIEVEYVS